MPNDHTSVPVENIPVANDSGAIHLNCRQANNHTDKQRYKVRASVVVFNGLKVTDWKVPAGVRDVNWLFATDLMFQISSEPKISDLATMFCIEQHISGREILFL